MIIGIMFGFAILSFGFGIIETIIVKRVRAALTSFLLSGICFTGAVCLLLKFIEKL